MSLDIKRNEKAQRDSRKKMVELKKENLELKKKLQEYETEKKTIPFFPHRKPM